MHALKNDAQVCYSNFMHVQMVSLRMTEEADTIDIVMGLLQFGLCDTFLQAHGKYWPFNPTPTDKVFHQKFRQFNFLPHIFFL